MEFYSKESDKIGFGDKLEHSVCPSSDYPFAKEKYSVNDSRYKLVNAYKKLIFEAKGIEIYNCKIETPKLAQGMYNVYIYLTDIRKELGDSYDPFFNKNEEFIVLFKQALLEYPVKELQYLNLNRNGIFIQDFNKCAKAYALSQSFRILHSALKDKYPMIEYLALWDTIIYVFFPDSASIDNFLDMENIKHFKQFSYEIIKQFDVENVCSPDNLSFMLDNYTNYKTLGGQHYFNSDAMSEGVSI